MNKLEQYAERMEVIFGRCDGGRDYPWSQAAKDMDALYQEIKRYRPRSKGNVLTRMLLMNHAKEWCDNWTRETI